MGLEDGDDSFGAPEASRFKRGADFRGMMPIVIHDCHAFEFRFDLESAVGAAEAVQAAADLLGGQVKLQTHGDCCQGILHVVPPRNMDGKTPQRLPSGLDFEA